MAAEPAEMACSVSPRQRACSASRLRAMNPSKPWPDQKGSIQARRSVDGRVVARDVDEQGHGGQERLGCAWSPGPGIRRRSPGRGPSLPSAKWALEVQVLHVQAERRQAEPGLIGSLSYLVGGHGRADGQVAELQVGLRQVVRGAQLHAEVFGLRACLCASVSSLIASSLRPSRLLMKPKVTSASASTHSRRRHGPRPARARPVPWRWCSRPRSARCWRRWRCARAYCRIGGSAGVASTVARATSTASAAALRSSISIRYEARRSPILAGQLDVFGASALVGLRDEPLPQPSEQVDGALVGRHCPPRGVAEQQAQLGAGQGRPSSPARLPAATRRAPGS